MNSDFPRILTLLRKERGISQKQAASELAISQALLSHYERGIRECGLDFVVRAANYYHVSCDYLLGCSPERNGTTLSMEDLPEPDQAGKGNMTRGAAGSILPMGPEITHAAQPVEELELRIYTGQDGEYLLYEDSGDGYDYEKGVYAQLPLRWRDAEQTLELGPKAGSFPFSWKLRLALATPEGERQGPLICCDGAEAMQVRLAAGEKE